MPESQPDHKLVVVDFDGTLLRGNSFSIFTLWLFKRLLSRIDLLKGFAVMGWVLLRKFRFISHSEVKQRLMKIAEDSFTESDFETFARSLQSSLNPEVVELISCRKSAGEYLCLATAAPYSYASVLGKDLGFDMVLATVIGKRDCERGWSANFEECKGEVKLNRVKALCEDNKLKPSLFLTDHIDDLPLMRWIYERGGEVGLISPDKDTIKKIRAYFGVLYLESGSKIKILVK